MPCTAPLPAWRPSVAGGRPRIGETARTDVETFRLDCGQCLSCRIARQRDWAVRAVHETVISGARRAAFLTLTYNDAHLPPDGGLRRRDLTLFLKRFRKAHGAGIRYLAAGEYGDARLRPHYHLALWGHEFTDKQAWKRTRRGDTLYRSEALDRAWTCPKCSGPIGHTWLGNLEFASAAYVAGYVTKKVTGGPSFYSYLRLNPDGEMVSVEPEFSVMSRRPGLGAEFYRRFRSDLFPKDYVHVQKGDTVKRYPVPRYYRKLLEADDPEMAQACKDKRQAEALARAEADTPALRQARDATARGFRDLYGHPADDSVRAHAGFMRYARGQILSARYHDQETTDG